MSESILTDKFEIRRGLGCYCTARGHMEGGKAVIDEFNIIETDVIVHCETYPVTLAVEDRMRLEKHLAIEWESIIKREIKAAAQGVPSYRLGFGAA